MNAPDTLRQLARLASEAGASTVALDAEALAERLAIAPESAASTLLDVVRLRGHRVRALERDALAYLERLFEINSARITNDFRDRVMESRRLLEQELRSRLREITASGERALARARDVHAEGAAAVSAELERIRRLRAQAAALRPRQEV